MRQSRDQNKLFFVRRELHQRMEAFRAQQNKADMRFVDRNEVMDIVEGIIEEVFEQSFDDDRCFNECKMMYFCEKKKGHSGGHSEGGLGPW